MQIENDGRLVIRDGDHVAGVYVFGDAHKSFLHDLATPDGHVVSATSPSDHVHHKGLMFALRASDVNWWEEQASPENGVLGQQRHDAFEAVQIDGDEVGFTQRLDWVGDAGSHLLEKRVIACRRLGDAFCWRWRSELTACRDLEFIQSPWSHERGGVRTNYHGLGLRLRRDMSGAGRRRLTLDGQRFAAVADGMRGQPGSLVLDAALDPVYPRWPPPCVRVAINQLHPHRNGLFCMDAPFGYLAMGPSNLNPWRLARGQTHVEQYEIRISDLQQF